MKTERIIIAEAEFNRNDIDCIIRENAKNAPEGAYWSVTRHCKNGNVHIRLCW